MLPALRRATPLVDHGWEANEARSVPSIRSRSPCVHSPTMVDIDAEVAPLRAEVERLRRLVGPCEQSYDDLRSDVLAARDAAKSAEQAAGELRGELTEAYAALDRALVGAPAFAHLMRQVKNLLSGTFLGRAYRTAAPARAASRLARPASAEPHDDRSASSLLRPDARLRPRSRRTSRRAWSRCGRRRSSAGSTWSSTMARPRRGSPRCSPRRPPQTVVCEWSTAPAAVGQWPHVATPSPRRPVS